MTKKLLSILLVWLALFIPVAYAAPALHFNTLNNTGMLGAGYNMIQDHQGFIWMSSYHSGLYRYDGYEFKHFEYQAKTSGSLPHDLVTSMFEDQKNRLWLGTHDGLVLFNAKTGDSKSYLPPPDQDYSQQNRQIRKIVSDGKTGLWLATRQGLQHFDPDTGQFRIYQHDPGQSESLARNNVDTLVLDRQGGLWLATWPGGMDYLPEGSSQFQHFQINTQDPLANNARSLFIDSRQRLWIGTEFGIFLKEFDQDWTQKRQLLVPNFPEGFRVNSFFEDNSGVIWVATTVGLFRWDEIQQQFDVYKHHIENPNSLASNFIYSLLQDRSGGFWVSTIEGISFADLSLDGLEQLIPRTFNGGNSSVQNEITALASAESGLLWLGGQSTLLLVDPQNRQIIKNLSTKKDGILNGRIYSLYQQPNGPLYLGTRNGLIRFDSGQQRFQAIPLGDVGSNFINKIVPGVSGILWLGTGGGLIEYDPKSGNHRKFQHDPLDPHSLSNNSVIALLADRAGKVWAGGKASGGGLSVRDPVTGQFQHYQFDPGDPASLGDNFVSDILEDSHGRVWIATARGLSLARVAPDGGLSFKNYTRRNGLGSNYILAINVDKTGMLWLSTDAGISRFDPETERFNNYQLNKDQAVGQNSGTSVMSSDGELYFSCIYGLLIVQTEHIRNNQISPAVAITDISVLNHSLADIHKVDSVKLEGSVTEPKALSLPWEKSVISLNFTALHFADPNRNRYAYKMEGFDQNWVEIDSRNRVATYTNLNPGNYLFRVKASNNTGIWNETGVSLPITIVPPYWKTLWFRAIAGGISLGLLISGYYWRIRQLKQIQANLEEQVVKRTEELTVVVQIKGAFLANMSHEIRTPMNAIMGMTHLILQTDLTAKQRNYLDKIHTSSTWLLGILNDILDFSKLEAGKLRLEHAEFRLEAIMQYLADVSTPLLNDKPLALNFELDPAMPAVLLGDSLRLGQVLLNLLSNAIKFTETGTVTVRSEVLAADQKQAYLRFSVSDTGIGLSEQQQGQLFSAFTQADDSTTRKYGGTGLGLSISKELIAAMGGAIGVESRLGLGSRFYFTITLDVQTMTNPLLVTTKQLAKYPTLNDAYLLLVEDNLINQEFMPEILGHEGIRVDLADNGEEAIAMISKNNYSAVLMDCQMPVMDGFEATRLIRADPRFADLPIIAMTANVMKEDIECCLASGMNDHVGKPIDWELFFQTLERWVKPRTSEPVSVADTVNLSRVKPSLAGDVNPAAAAANAGPSFPQLTGVDLEIVRRQTGNNAALYRKILALFCANHEHDLELIKAARQAGDYETAIDLAHKLKGSVSSMAMATLAGLTIGLEQALKQRDDILLEALLEKTGTVLTRLITEIHQLESPADDVTLLQRVMAELSALLANASFITDELLTRLKMLLPDEQRADYHALIQHTLDTDYPKAQSVLNTLIGSSGEQVTTADQDRRPIVLIVDDMRVNQELLVSLLSRDYRIKVAGNGPMALEIAECIPHPDLVLLDINMPQMDGYEVCRKLQENPDTRDIPVIFVTAASDQASEIQGLELGAVDYITKPISPAIALLRVRNQILLRQHEKQLKHIAHYDILTGIPNRVLLADRMKQAIAQTKREQKMLAVCYLDLDGFKLINDTLGHQAGDQVLIECASRIANMLRESDTVARLGGDEFVILLPNLHHVEECIATLNRLLETIALPIFIQERSCCLTVSIGVSIYPGDDKEPDDLLRLADQAMYIAKQSGKSRYHLFDPSYEQQIRAQHVTLFSIK